MAFHFNAAPFLNYQRAKSLENIRGHIDAVAITSAKKKKKRRETTLVQIRNHEREPPMAYPQA